MSISVIDFFCGCGGTSAGLRLSGMNIVAGIDIDEIALETFNKNFPEAKSFNKDINSLDPADIEKLTKNSSFPVLFSACAPCQPFSKQNRQKSKNDERESLLDALHPFVKKCMPDYILLENVPGLQKIKEGPFTRFTDFLEQLGYSFDADIKDAKSYGVPQTRRRLVLIASKHGKINLPKETHGSVENLKPYKTVWETIRGYHPLRAGEKSSRIPNHQTARISELNLERIKHTPEGGDRRDWPERLLLDCHKGNLGYTDTYGRLRKDKYAATLTTRCVSLSNGRYGHPTQNRALSVREAAALQTFEEDFVFEGSLIQAAKQVGNAVPVVFAKALGKAIIQHQGKN
ncbi:DNA cytosine methyltransferase [SAR92 clade bacterium H231]|nr:DNA cytosine methyltransferase [SAR92 clade bacterium H231]